MSAALHLARPEDLDRLAALVGSCDEEAGLSRSDDDRHAALAPLLEGLPHGVIYLIGPARAPMGFVAISLGWSVELGGLSGRIDQIWLRRAVRRRGIATEILTALPAALAGAGLKALHMPVDSRNEAALRLAARAKFMPQEDVALMSRVL